MPANRKRWMIVGVWVLACAGPVFPQTADRGDPSWARTPQDREKFYGHVMDRYMDRLTKAYRLDEQQQAQVRSQLERLKAEQESYATPLRPQFEAAVREWQTLRSQRKAGQQIDAQRYEELRTQMRQMWQQSPLLNPTHVVSSVEQILPPEQVRRGRKHRDEMLGELSRGRDERSHSRREGEGRRERADSDAQAAEPPSVDRWRQYVTDFSRKYQLDDSQRSTADSLLRSAIEQRDAYEKSREADYAAAAALKDPVERAQRLKSLNEPTRSYFEQLKTGLERIPTMAQREAVESPAAQSQPASAPHEHRGRHNSSRQ